jgi:transposase-like protein
LVSEEEMLRAIEKDDHYIIIPAGVIRKAELLKQLREYTSNNTYMLRIDEIFSLLKGKGWV